MSGRDLQAWTPTIRVGMPLVGGRLLQLGVGTGLPLLFSANAFARVGPDKAFRGFNLEAARRLPETLDAALDSAGFVASVLYPDYRWSLDDYLELVAARPWTWAACPDYCVEPQIAPDAAVRKLRIEATVTMFHRTLERAAQRGITVPLMGVVQGWFADEYVQCVEDMFGDDWPNLVGVGSVCRRHLGGPDGVLAIVQALDRVMPAHSRLHLFGVKSGALATLAPWAHRIASVDSMAYDAAVRRAMPRGRTQEMRAHAMVQWHGRQVQMLHQLPTGRQDATTAVASSTALRSVTTADAALTAVGNALAQLHGDGEMTYLDAKLLTLHDAATVRGVLQVYGPDAFAEEEPEEDFGLGIVYDRVRAALDESGAFHRCGDLLEAGRICEARLT